MSSSRQNGETQSEPMVGNYRIGSEIGKGSFAAVYKGVHMKNKSLVAIKSVLIAKLNKKLLENLEAEIQILKTINHPHIVSLLDCQKSPRYIHLIMEYCSLGDLSAFIKRREKLADHPATAEISTAYPMPSKGGLNEVVVRHFLKQLASALEFLRSKNLIHRDVKPQNLLLDPPPSYQVPQGDEGRGMSASQGLVGLPTLPLLKLADFGFARELQNASMAETLCGSPLYMAPEILRYEKYDAKADLWSVGTVLYEMAVGKPPFRASNHMDLLKKIEQQNDRVEFPSYCEASKELRSLICQLLKRSPVERISFADFFNNPVIKGEIPGAIGEVKPVETTPEQVPQRRNTPLEKTEVRKPEKERHSMERQKSRHRVNPQVHESDEHSDLPFAHPSAAAPQPNSHRPSESRRTTTITQLHQSAAVHDPPRPVMISHATSPARQEMLIERAVSTPMERRISHKSSPPRSPGIPQMQQHTRDKDKERERAQAQHARDAARQRYDEALESEYVMVEKRAVEVNALADELAASPRVTGKPPISPTPSNALLSRRSYSATGKPGSQRPVSSGKQQPTSIPRSVDRKYGSSPGSGGSALARALSVANARLWGLGYSPPNRYSPPNPNPFPAYPTAAYHAGSMVVVQNPGSSNTVDDYDTKAFNEIEECCSKSDVVFHFAAVKYSQLVPVAPRIPQGLGLLPSATQEKEQTQTMDINAPETDLTPEAVMHLAEQALVLYVKCLSLLAKAIGMVGIWWANVNQSNSEPPISQHRAEASVKINKACQWARDRFNETLEKAEYVRLKLKEAQLKLPIDHPNHPSNQPIISGNDAGKTGSITPATAATATTVDKVYITPGINAEKLIIERAVEMSRGAAVNELLGNDLEGCHMSYVTALKLLEAVLEKDQDATVDESLDKHDTDTIQNLINGLRARIETSKQKIIYISKRPSDIHSVPHSPIPSHSPQINTPPR